MSAVIPATLIAGDGIGPEIVDATLAALDALKAPFEWDRQVAGLGGVQQAGDPLPAATLDSIRRTRLALKGPLETPSGGGYRSSNVRLREEFQLYANLRPARTIIPGGRFDNIDLVVVRENLEGLYIGHEHYVPIDGDPHAVAMATGINTRQGSRRLLEYAFETAVATGRKKVTIVHKANIMKALTGIFLETGLDLYERKYKGKFELDTVIIDACAMKLVLNPWQFDMLVTTNLFGDILSDLVAGLVGGLGMAPGANIGADAAIFEAVHGSAPDIAGKGIANPTALLLAAALDARPLQAAGAGHAPAHGHRRDAEHRQGAHRRPGRQRRHRGLHQGTGEPNRRRLTGACTGRRRDVRASLPASLNRHHMELRQLRYFVRTVELGSIGRAALDLDLVPSALSQQISRLEGELSTRLLQRKAKGVVPTEAGLAFFREAQLTLRHADQAARVAQHARLTGTVSVGLAPTTAAVLAMPFMRAMRERYPDVRLHMVESLSGHLTAMLNARQLDLAILFNTQAATRWSVMPLLEEKLLLIRARRHMSPTAAASTRSISTARLAKLPLILPTGTHGLRSVIDAAFAARRRGASAGGRDRFAGDAHGHRRCRLRRHRAARRGASGACRTRPSASTWRRSRTRGPAPQRGVQPVRRRALAGCAGGAHRADRDGPRAGAGGALARRLAVRT